MTFAADATKPATRELLLHPFRGLRYNSEQVPDVGAVSSPPYDVMDRPMIEELLQRHPRNIVRLVLPRLVADPVRTDSPDAHAAKLLQRWTDQGALKADSQPALYLYEYGDESCRVCGVIGALELPAHTQRTVLPHESVIPDIVADRLAMMSAAQANLEPILLVYDGAGETTSLLSAVKAAPPLIDVNLTDGTTHQLWSITDPAPLRQIQDAIAPHQALIADGHHRYATYLELQRRHRLAGSPAGPWDRGLALLIDSTQYRLQLGAIHRSVSDVSLAALQMPLGYRISPAISVAGARPAPPAEVRHLVVTDGERSCTVVAPISPEAATADAELLHQCLLPAWGAQEDRLGYHHAVEQAVRAAKLEGGVAVLLHPPRLDQVMALARAGKVLPRKSTSFGPKPRTGFVMRRFVDEG